MSRNSLDKYSKIKSFILKHNRKGIRILFLFKFLKTEVSKKFDMSTISEEQLNRVCMEKAVAIFNLGRNKPTEDDIKEILLKIASRNEMNFRDRIHSLR